MLNYKTLLTPKSSSGSNSFNFDESEYIRCNRRNLNGLESRQSQVSVEKEIKIIDVENKPILLLWFNTIVSFVYDDKLMGKRAKL